MLVSLRRLCARKATPGGGRLARCPAIALGSGATCTGSWRRFTLLKVNMKEMTAMKYGASGLPLWSESSDDWGKVASASRASGSPLGNAAVAGNFGIAKETLKIRRG